MQKKSLWQEAVYWVLLAALLTAGGFLLFTNLGETGISDCDEARHGINAYEMMQSGDYVVTTYRGEPDYWNLKPPLTDYCIMLGYQLFGYNALGLRFYSALSMMLTMIVLALWTRHRYGRVASLCTQLMLLGCSFIYGPHFARFGDADAQMLLFYVVAMIFMLESHRRPRLLYGTALCFGLAFMSKSWHAALIPVTCLIYLLVTGEIRRLRPRHYLGLIFFGLLPIAPWAIARYQRDGMLFFEKMLSIDVVKRATSVHEEHRGGVGYYVSYLLSDRTVIAATAIVLIALCWKVVRRLRLSRDQWGILLWFAVPLVLYSLCVSKLSWYIFVSLPPLAVGFGMACAKLACGALRTGWKALPRVACLAAAVFESLGMTTTPPALEERADIIQAIQMKNPERLVAFCQGIQMASPIDSMALPEPWAMPGYQDQVVMAAGTFVSGASIELSADAPMREPYTAYMQGGLTYIHGRVALAKALERMVSQGCLEL